MNGDTDLNFIDNIIATKNIRYLPNHGNLGDALITGASRKFFEEYQYTFDRNADTVVVSGGGNMIALYNTLIDSVSNISRYKRVIILPSSVDLVQGKRLKKINERMTNDMIIFSREEKTHEILTDLGIESYLADDMAFTYDYSEFIRDGGNGLGICFRKDSESLLRKSSGKIETDDISSSNYGWWMIDNVSTSASRNFVNRVSKYRKILTDRLHIAIAAAKLGREVHVFSNNYHKVSGVYHYSLKAFDNVTFHGEDFSYYHELRI